MSTLRLVASPALVGTALVCGASLAYQILSTRLLAVVLEGSMVIFAVALAMLGMGVATSFLSLGKPSASHQAGTGRLGYVATALGVSYVLSLAGLTFASDLSNAQIEMAIEAGGLNAVVESVRSTMGGKMVLVAAILFAPYFIFGIFIALLFRSLANGEYHRFYAADLIGASLGCILSIAVLELAGYEGCLALILVATFLGAGAFAGAASKRVLLANLCLAATATAVWNPSILKHLEPEPALGQLSRNYDQVNDVTEDWHRWTAQSRVALLSMQNKRSGETRQAYAHEDGSGWALVPGKDVNPWSKLAVMFEPKRVLVLFAGVGADMVEIDQACGGRCEITGVEINGQMIAHAFASGTPELRSFLGRPGVRLEVAEAREYLERDRNHYDVILLSWWGAGISHFVGTSGKLAQYAYTTEGYASLLHHLNPNGTLIVYNSSKAQSLVTLREVFAQQGFGNIADSVVVLKGRNADAATGRFRFYDTLENMRLIVKPSGFSVADMEVVRATAAALSADVVLSPNWVDPAYGTYRDIVSGKPVEEINGGLISDGIELSVVSDDRPFINELVPRSYYWNIGHWFQAGSEGWVITNKFIRFTLLLAIIAAILIVGPLLLKSGPPLSGRTIGEMSYFLSIGAGFILIEVGLVRKLGLLLGSPSHSISIVLAALILATGLGSIFSDSLFRSGTLTVKRTAVAIVTYLLLASALYDASVETVIALPLVVKCVIVVLFLMPLGFLMGQLFPQGLVRAGREDERLVPWAWAINSATSTIFVGAGYLLSYPFGFNALLYLGAAFYAALVVLPVSRQAAARPELAAVAP